MQEEGLAKIGKSKTDEPDEDEDEDTLGIFEEDEDAVSFISCTVVVFWAEPPALLPTLPRILPLTLTLTLPLPIPLTLPPNPNPNPKVGNEVSAAKYRLLLDSMSKEQQERYGASYLPLPPYPYP